MRTMHDKVDIPIYRRLFFTGVPLMVKKCGPTEAFTAFTHFFQYHGGRILLVIFASYTKFAVVFSSL